MELQIAAPAPVVINSVESAVGSHDVLDNTNLEVRTSTIVQPQVGALYREKLIVSESANYAPAGPPGPEGPPGPAGSGEMLLDAHINSAMPHPAYDIDMPTLNLIFENGLI